MRPDYESQTTPLQARTASQEALVALVWIGGGAIALLALCTFGPASVEYASASSLPFVVLVPLISLFIAAWDVGGLMLIMIGIRCLLKLRVKEHPD